MTEPDVLDTGAAPTDRPGRAGPDDRPPRHRPSVRVLAALGAAASLVLSGLFVAVDLHYNQGHLIAPLDDTYIHLQYARQFGTGHPFEYTSGAAPSMGASSLLYVLVLGAAAAVGVGGTALLAAAVTLGAVCLAGTVALVVVLGDRLAGRSAGCWAGALTLVSGPLLWGATSGMEVAPTALLATATVLAFVVEQPRVRFVVTPLVGVLLALVRPEGLLLAGAVCAGMLWTIGRTTWADRRPVAPALARAALALLPLVAGAGQLLLGVAVTGHAQANGVLSKSWWTQGTLREPTEVADHTLRTVQNVAATLTGLSAQDLVPPATLPLAVVGLVALGFARGSRWRTLAGVLALGLVAVLVGISTLITAEWQNQRYLQPFLPLILLLAVLGVHALVGLAADPHRRRVALHGLLAVALVFSLAVLPTWALRLGQQAATIREGPVTIANWLAGRLPPGSTVAVNDVGAVGWFGGHRTVDLVGLTTDGLAPAANAGAGTLYEALVHLPPGERPDWFSIYEKWGGVPVQDLAAGGVLGERPVMTFSLVSPSRPVEGTAPTPCQTDRSCPTVNLWRADWSRAGSGDLPDAPVPGVVRDHLNVADLADEAAHGWTADTPVLGVQPTSAVREQQVGPGRVVVDSSRRVVGGETFTLSGLTPGRPVTLTGRIGAGAGPGGSSAAAAAPSPLGGEDDGAAAVAVAVGDRPVGRWSLATDPTDADGWAQSTLTIPAELVTGPTITVHTAPLKPFLGPYPDYRSYGYWASQ